MLSTSGLSIPQVTKWATQQRRLCREGRILVATGAEASHGEGASGEEVDGLRAEAGGWTGKREVLDSLA